jgi:hypothetical protein
MRPRSGSSKDDRSTYSKVQTKNVSETPSHTAAVSHASLGLHGNSIHVQIILYYVYSCYVTWCVVHGTKQLRWCQKQWRTACSQSVIASQILKWRIHLNIARRVTLTCALRIRRISK